MALSLAATQTAAHPPEPDHGTNETTFGTLWSGDKDAMNGSDLQVDANESSMALLAAGTDIPFDAPPAAVDQWNRGDHRDFPATNATTSIHPPNATLSDGTFVKDAYAEIFAVTPSTRANLSPSSRPHYIASNGSVLGTVDYRVAIPSNVSTGDRRVFWSRERHHIVDTRLLVDGRRVANTSRTHTPALNYSRVGGVFGSEHTLSLESTVAVELRKRVRTCADHDDAGGCTDWQHTVEYRSENVTVRDSIDVVSYALHIGGFRAEYPNGDLGLVIYKSQPWLGHSVPGGDVRGVWRFYSARDEDWDTLITSSANGDTASHSPLHPLQTYAYPIETGPTPSPRGSVSILETYGVNTTPPTLPPDVHLDALTQPYTASHGIATRTETTNHDLTAIEAHGLVRGVTARAADGPFVEVPINQSELTLSVVNRTAETVTVRVRLRDATTGVPINTDSRGGSVFLAGTRVETSGNGTVTKTFVRPPSGLSARYEPGQWWRNLPGYTGDSDVVYVRGTGPQIVETLYGIVVPVSLFLLAVFLIDRITGWRIWPPWRGV